MSGSPGPHAESWVIPAALEGQRVDRVLSLLTGLARRQVSEMIDAGQVEISSRTVTSRSRRMHAGERLHAVIAEQVTEPGPAADLSVTVTVVWADEQVAVIDKPAGIVVHPGTGNRTGTLVHGLLARFPELADLAAPPPAAAGAGRTGTLGDRDRPGIVHRLDKGTSGLLMVARTPAARRSLSAQLAARSVERRYATLVHGSLLSDEGVIDAPLGRSSADHTRMTVLAAGRPARTRYRVMARFVDPWPATLLECQLESGRTHQVRVHLAAIGHPVVGDEQYRDGAARPVSSPRTASRTWLHARALGFDHPITGERLRFVSPLPPDLVPSVGDLHPAEGSLPPSWLRVETCAGP